MEKQKYQDYPQGVQRASILKAHAEGSEDKVIFRPMSDEEIIATEKELAGLAVNIRAHDDVLDEAKVQHKKNTVELKQDYEYALKKIRVRGEEKNTIVHKFFNHDEMTVEYFDDDGIFVEARPMMPSEKNAIFGSKKTEAVVHTLTGTND